jgi:hypothetical protein
MTPVRISVRSDFSPYPGGRFRADGDFSGEEFREQVLLPALRDALNKGSRVEVLLDGVAGYASSFLEEAFGGTVRAGVAPFPILEDTLVVRADDPLYDIYKRLADEFMQDAARVGGSAPDGRGGRRSGTEPIARAG